MPVSLRAKWQGLDEYWKIFKQTPKEIQKEVYDIPLAGGEQPFLGTRATLAPSWEEYEQTL